MLRGAPTGGTQQYVNWTRGSSQSDVYTSTAVQQLYKQYLAAVVGHHLCHRCQRNHASLGEVMGWMRAALGRD